MHRSHRCISLPNGTTVVRSCGVGCGALARPRTTRLYGVVVRAEPKVTGNSTGFDFSKFANKTYLDNAARRYSVGLRAGISEDELLLFELGATDGQLTDTQRAYKGKVKEKLAQRAEELQREEEELKARLARNMLLGQRAYERGEYLDSARFLEQGVKDAGPDSVIGGEAQLWLALAYQALGREQECIDLYKRIEESHPVKKIRKQAADLRYIMEAPKLPLREDEVVKIPLLNSDTWRKGERSSYSKSRVAKARGGGTSSYWDKATWDTPPPLTLPDKWYVRVLAVFVGVLFLATCTYLNYQYATEGGRL